MPTIAGASAQLCARNPARWPAPGEAAPAHHRGGNPALYPAAGAAAQLPENGGGISAAVRPEPGAMACTWGSRASASPGRQS
ncbi:hypothetical protein, partial [Citrobacter freundii]|uniref:hypothetical protein n=2 Tax=Citrobacter freundii complex TaxID=1344959 RepID=UPI00397D7F67